MIQDHDAKLEMMTKQLVAAGLPEIFTGDGGGEAMRLAPDGARVARQLAMSDDDSQEALMDALVGEGSD